MCSIGSVNVRTSTFDSWNLIAGDRVTEWNRLLCLLMVLGPHPQSAGITSITASSAGRFQRRNCKALLQSGAIPKDTMIWIKGMPGWLPANQASKKLPASTRAAHVHHGSAPWRVWVLIALVIAGLPVLEMFVAPEAGRRPQQCARHSPLVFLPLEFCQGTIVGSTPRS